MEIAKFLGNLFQLFKNVFSYLKTHVKLALNWRASSKLDLDPLHVFLEEMLRALYGLSAISCF